MSSTICVLLIVVVGVSTLVVASPPGSRSRTTRDVQMTSDSARQDAELDAELASDLQWLREKTTQLASIAERIRSVLRVQGARRGNAPYPVQQYPARTTVNKRHCWDVADVCCMWNIC